MEQLLTATTSSPSTTPDLPFGRPTLGPAELALLEDVFASGTLTHGPLVKRFEREFAHFTRAPHALATSSCMGALHLAYLSLGVRPGDEVIVPAQTHVATAMAIEVAGGRCVFVDVDPDTGNIDLAAVRDAITPRTRGVAIVHFLGLPVDMRALLAITREHSLFVVEDCALALGATCHGVHVGLCGDVGAFSFYPAKHITTGEGGMLVTTRGDLANLGARMRAFGIDRDAPGVRPGGLDYDATVIGLNYRMSELAGALGVCQMKRLSDILATRRSNFEALAAELAAIDEITLLRSSHDGLQSAWYCLSFLLVGELGDRRDEVADFLRARGIGVSVYYPRPVPHMSVFRDRPGHGDGSFPEAARISRQSIALPVGPHLARRDIDRIASAVRHAIRSLHPRPQSRSS